MKEFKRVNQNDLVLEFLNYVNENLWVDVDSLEVTKYIDDDVLKFYKSKSIFVTLNNVEYYVNLFYNDLEKETYLKIFEIIDCDNNEMLCEIRVWNYTSKGEKK